jgi:hypothetical protein
MSIPSEHSEHSAHSSGSVVQLLTTVAVVVSGLAITAIWFYLRW